MSANSEVHPLKKSVHTVVESVARKIYGYDLDRAKEFMALYIGTSHSILNHPDTLAELDLLTDMEGDPTPAFYKNVTMTRLESGEKLIQFTEPTYRLSDASKAKESKFFYGMSITVMYDNSGQLKELTAMNRSHDTHVTWTRNDQGTKPSYTVDIQNMPDGIIDSQKFAKDFLRETNAAVFTFIDRLGTTKYDVEAFQRSSTREHLRDDVVKRQGRMDREMFFHEIGNVTPYVIGAGASYVSPLFAGAVAAGLMMAAPESKTSKRFATGVLAPVLLRLVGCADPEIPTNGKFEIVDLTEQVKLVGQKPFEANPRVPMVSETSITSYSERFMVSLSDPTSPEYMGYRLGYSDSRVFDVFTEKTNLKFITKNILSWLSTGDVASSNPAAWETVAVGPGVDIHQQIVQAISLEGIGNGQVKLIGYFDLNQHRGSNILRQGLVIEFEGKQYMLKIQPYKSAVQETTSLTRIKQIDPDILVADESVFKRVFSNRSKMTVTVSDLILVNSSEGVSSMMAPTLETFLLNNQPLSEIQLTQLSRIYRTMLISHLSASPESPFLGADILKPANIAIDNTGSLVVIDGFSSRTSSFAMVQDGKIVVTQSDPLKHLLEAKNMLKRLGLTDSQLGMIESDALNMYGRMVEPGSTSTVNLVNATGESPQAVATITNDSPDPIYVPNEVLVPRWVRAFGTTLNVLFAAWIAKATYDYILPFDVLEESAQEPANLYSRRGLDIDTYLSLTIDAPDSPPYAEILLAHSLNSISLAVIVENMDAFHASQEFRTQFNIPTKSALADQLYARRLAIESAGYATPIRDPLEVWIVPEGSKGNSLFVKQPFYSASEKTVYLEPTEVSWDGFAERSVEYMRNAVIQFDQVLTGTVQSVLAGQAGSEAVFDQLQSAVNDGVIDFFTISSKGYLVYGYATGSAIELRRVATYDTYNSLQVLRAVKLSEFIV